MEATFTIIGGGIAGLTAAIALRRQGLDPLIFEAAPELHPVGAGLGLAANAIRALALLGVEKEILAKGRFLEGMSFRTDKDALLIRMQTNAVTQRAGQDNFSIHRADLHESLLHHLDSSRIFTGKALESLEHEGRRLRLRFLDGSEHQTDFLVGADGIHSAVRRVVLPDVRPRYAGYTCWRCIVPVALPEGRQEVEEILGPAGRFGIVPLTGNRTYWFACVNAPRRDPLMQKADVAALAQIFAGYPTRVLDLLKASEGQPLIWGDITDLPVKHRYNHGNIVLIGDAAHATTPNMGQGACQAIEDAVILAAEIGRRRDDPADAFRRFTDRRLERTRMVVRRSRMMGQIAQWQHPALRALRNLLFRLTPQAAFRRQLETLYNVDMA